MTTTDSPDYWSLLGLSSECSSDELKRAFRREARKWHPDLNRNDLIAEERFKLINEAYAVLSDPNKRSNWEKSFYSSLKSIDPFLDGFPHFEDYLESVLGINNDTTINNDSEEFEYNNTWPTQAPPSPPPVQIHEDLETIVELLPEQALYGTYVELELQDGTLVEIKTPQMAGDGWRLRLEGVALGGFDHFIQLRVFTEEGLRIDGLRVLYRLELFPADAVLGCAVEVPTLLGPVTLQVPPLSSSGRLLRLRGRGMELDGRKGDQIVEISIVIPSDIGEAENALYRRLQEITINPDPN